MLNLLGTPDELSIPRFTILPWSLSIMVLTFVEHVMTPVTACRNVVCRSYHAWLCRAFYFMLIYVKSFRFISFHLISFYFSIKIRFISFHFMLCAGAARGPEAPAVPLARPEQADADDYAL